MLIRHALAGQYITQKDVRQILGHVVCQRIGQKLIAALTHWLQCNQREKSNILRPTTHPAYLELALQRLYCLWPNLLIEAIESPTVTSGPLRQPQHSRRRSKATTNRSDRPSYVFALAWENRLQTQNAFRQPDSYLPNINRI